MSAEPYSSTMPVPFPGMRVRAMQYADVPRVSQVEVASYAFPWSAGIFRDCIRAGYLCHVVELRGELIAHAILSIGGGDAHVLNVCVGSDYRERGLGRYLMHLLTDVSRAARAESLFLEVRPSNPAAIHLYESLGFRRVGVRKGYYQSSGFGGSSREDAWVYKLTL